MTLTVTEALWLVRKHLNRLGAGRGAGFLSLSIPRPDDVLLAEKRVLEALERGDHLWATTVLGFAVGVLLAHQNLTPAEADEILNSQKCEDGILLETMTGAEAREHFGSYPDPAKE